ncbi:deoxyribodipyrimidine photo-lyase [Devosia sp. J2-20]|uniref:cryptochrome/photolyase family protein n=1 Tax=Devosia sp. J2-20 TaxID=3026161 RepID=UPI00249AF85B|nr:deoxyribodipyrimidine photo-lyase [Devosia sp. J2-20]WDQ98226.1 deoxyribodipyrimidine photo-lyase [Devosia sp. J2-20]
MNSTTIAWLRNDLRVADNPALAAAQRSGERVIALYIHEQTIGVRPPGAAARWWLHQSLNALEVDLAALGIELRVHQGDPNVIVVALANQENASGVFWNRRYAAGERAVDTAIKEQLRAEGVAVESFGANVLIEPWEIATGQGKPYSVFTPFWKTLKQRHIEQPLDTPAAGKARSVRAVDDGYAEPHWAAKLSGHWYVGEKAARRTLADFLDYRVGRYPDERDLPDSDATSNLSPHLRFGEISPRQIWQAANMAADIAPENAGAIDKFLSELAWRDFSYHQLYHRCDIAQAPMQAKYAGMAWRDAADDLRAWQRGQTGLPMIDAGMRELWETGYMHNRVRMLVASLLSKNLLIDWRQGEKWFWDCLVDGDVASNPASWQWVAGSGLDAAPYFRIFNPVTQGGRFDAEGAYVRRWVPELAAMPDKWVHTPWQAPAEVLKAAHVQIGTTYPAPIVDLKASRERALQAASAL